MLQNNRDKHCKTNFLKKWEAVFLPCVLPRLKPNSQSMAAFWSHAYNDQALPRVN